jgi:hypothetical protein
MSRRRSSRSRTPSARILDENNGTEFELSSHQRDRAGSVGVDGEKFSDSFLLRSRFKLTFSFTSHYLPPPLTGRRSTRFGSASVEDAYDDEDDDNSDLQPRGSKRRRTATIIESEAETEEPRPQTPSATGESQDQHRPTSPIAIEDDSDDEAPVPERTTKRRRSDMTADIDAFYSEARTRKGRGTKMFRRCLKCKSDPPYVVFSF